MHITVSETSIAFYLGLHDSRKSNIKVFVSYKQFDRVTTVFIHDCTGKEKQHLLDRLKDTGLYTLTVHPLLLITVVMELLHDEMWEDVELVYRDSLAPIIEAEERTNGTGKEQDPQPESIRALNLSHSASAHVWRMKQLRDFVSCLRLWIEEYTKPEESQEQNMFTTTKMILLERVDYLDGSLREAHIQLEQADRYVQIYRQWVKCHS